MQNSGGLGGRRTDRWAGNDVGRVYGWSKRCFMNGLGVGSLCFCSTLTSRVEKRGAEWEWENKGGCGTDWRRWRYVTHAFSWDGTIVSLYLFYSGIYHQLQPPNLLSSSRVNCATKVTAQQMYVCPERITLLWSQRAYTGEPNTLGYIARYLWTRLRCYTGS